MLQFMLIIMPMCSKGSVEEHRSTEVLEVHEGEVRVLEHGLFISWRSPVVREGHTYSSMCSGDRF